jgi:hypothetical protein
VQGVQAQIREDVTLQALSPGAITSVKSRMSDSLRTPFPNQPPAYVDRQLYTEDVALQEALRREGGGWAAETVAAWGASLGRAEVLAQGDAANRHPPELLTLDPRGERIDALTFHPAWHELMRLATSAGEHCAPWIEAWSRRASRSCGDVRAARAGGNRYAMSVDDDLRQRAGVAPRCRRIAGVA